MAASRAVRSHRWESAARWLRSMLPSHIVPSPDDSFCQHKTTDDFIIGGHIEVYLARLTIRTRCVLENEVRHTVSCICEAWLAGRVGELFWS
jgi:hypothetical protein